jgi:hypothetical protein
VKRAALFAVVATLSCSDSITHLGVLHGAWGTVETPQGFRHFRAAWVDANDRLWVAAVEHGSPFAADSGVGVDTGVPIDTGVAIDTGSPILADTTTGPDTSVADTKAVDTSPASPPPPPAPPSPGPPEVPEDFRALGAILAHDENGWQAFRSPFIANALWGADRDSLWLVTNDALIHARPPERFFNLHSPPRFSDVRTIFGLSEDALWAAGTAIVRFRGGRWIDDGWAGDFDRINALWGTSEDDIWAVSESGTIRHRTTAWQALQRIVPVALRGVWNSAPDNVWVVGDQGTLLHFDGKNWLSIDLGTKANLRSVWGTGPDDVWIAGDGGAILHWTGARMNREPSPTTDDLLMIVGSRNGNAWAFGDHVMLRLVR